MSSSSNTNSHLRRKAQATPSSDLGIECEFGFRKGRGRTRERLWASYEIAGMSISDDYTPFEITAEELLREWAERTKERHPSGIVPILWDVRGESRHETLPGTIVYYDEPYEQEDFVDFFSHPIRCDTGEPLRWIDLPVRDRGWSLERSDRGGYIQEATGWKPAIFQPFVLTDHLAGFQRTDDVRGSKEVTVFQSGLSEARR